MARLKPVVGEKLWLVIVSPRGQNNGIKCTVRKVGRVYFYLESGRGYMDDMEKYRLDNWFEQNNTNYQNFVMVNEQEWIDKKDARSIKDFLYRRFRDDIKLPVDTLRTIKQIIDTNEVK